MKPLILGFLVGGLLLFAAFQAQAAVSVTVTYTADNVIAAAYQNGGSPEPITLGGNAGEWKFADTVTLDLAYGTEYQFVFLARNSKTASENNPAGFLAEITGNVTGDLLTGSSWKYAVYDSNDPTPSDFDALTWYDATAHRPNGTSPWTTTVANISTDAYWIWDATNGLDGSSETGEILWIRGIVTTEVPEPTTLLIWSVLGALGMIAYGRRK